MMSNRFVLISALALIAAGCSTTSDSAKPEKGPKGTIAYYVEIESSEPGARIEVNQEDVGKTPLKLKVFGDEDGTFHNFGNYHYRITAYPPKPGQQPQTKDFRTGGWFTREDRIPKKLFFDFGAAPDSPTPEAK